MQDINFFFYNMYNNIFRKRCLVNSIIFCYNVVVAMVLVGWKVLYMWENYIGYNVLRWGVRYIDEGMYYI